MKIDLVSYRDWARTKCPVDMSTEDQMIDAALGLAGESAELLDVTRGLEFPPLIRILDESGDILFYAAWLLDVGDFLGRNPGRIQYLDCPQSHEVHHRDHDIAAVILFGKAVEAVKKHIFHGRRLDNFIFISSYIDRGLVALHRMLASRGSRLDIAMQYNIGKLDARYPDGFAIRYANEA